MSTKCLSPETYDEPSTPLLTANSESAFSDVGHIAIHYPFAEVKLYKRRWVNLSAFSLLGFMQGLLWNTWGPISTSAKVVFPGWNDATIALLSNWGNICYVLFLIPVIWIMDTKGLRSSTVLASSLVFVGAGIRCVTMDTQLETWFIHAGHFINGIAGIVVFAGPPQLSATWFPPNQRTTATGIIYIISSLGVAAGSVFSPIVVDELQHHNIVPVERQLLKEQILRLMFIQFVFASVLFLWILVYFPSKPPFPPSITAALDRLDFLGGVKILIRNKDVWFVGLAFGISTSIYACWITVIHINLELLGLGQKEAGWIGCYSILGGCVGTFVSSRLYDMQTSDRRRPRSLHRNVPRLRFICRTKRGIRHLLLVLDFLYAILIDVIGGKMKFMITIGLVGSTLCFLWFLGICMTVLPFSRPSLYLSLILGGVFNYGIQPIFMEMGAELAYPIGEAIVGGFVTGIFNVIGTVFLFLFFIPNIGYLWMNWCLIISTIVAIPVVLFIKENYARSSVDCHLRQPLIQT